MKLSRGSRFVLDALCKGKNRRFIADALGASLSAVDKRINRAKLQLGAETTYQAVVFYALQVAGGDVQKVLAPLPDEPARVTQRALAQRMGVSVRTIRRWNVGRRV